jgi:L-arabinokinase
MPALDVAQIDARDWTLVLTDRIQAMDAAATPPNVVYLPEHTFRDAGFRYEDLISAVDVVVSKPGYGIVSECITCDKPLLYTSRGVFSEYDVFVREMPRYLRCQFIGHDALFAGRWRDALERVRALPPAPERIASNGAEVAAEALATALGSI